MIKTYFINKRSLYKIEENNMSSAYQSDWKLVVNRLFLQNLWGYMEQPRKCVSSCLCRRDDQWKI